MPESQARFVAIANGKYAALKELTTAIADAEALKAILEARHDFTAIVLGDLDRGQLLNAIDRHLGDNTITDGALIVSWTGHGVVGRDRTLRLLGHSDGRDVEVAGAGQLGEWSTRTGARQVLVLLDTCYSAAGLVDAVTLATAVNEGRSSPGLGWFGLVAASLSDERSRSGVLTAALLRLLTTGPRQPDFRWHESRPYIRGDDLVQALLADWDEPRHTAYPILAGRAWDLVRNPLYVAGIADQPVEHLLFAARGGSGMASYFSGREQPVGAIVSWLQLARPGLCVVTGPAGSGKSAVVGRIVSLSSPTERARLLEASPVPGHLDPGAGSVDAQLPARGATVDTAADEIARQLGLPPGAGPFGVLGEAQRRRKAGSPLVVVVDGLDEARAFSRDLAIQLIQPLAQHAMVLVGTREVPSGETTLIKQLGPASQTIDLGQDVEATRRDVREYVIRRLTGVDASMNPEHVADALAPETGRTNTAPFLLARLVTSQLREHPVNTSSADWALALATTVESALERDLQKVVLEIDGQPHPNAAREMLRALTLAHGGGFPADEVWAAVASAISPTATQYGRDHTYAVIQAMNRHIVAASEGDQPVYRVAHQRLVDYLAASVPSPAGRTMREVVADTIFREYTELLDAGLQPVAHTYLWRYAWRHLAEAGAEGLERLHQLVARDRTAFLPDLALGLEFAGSAAWAVGQGERAVALHQEEVSIRRELTDPLRLAMSLFRLSIARTSIGDGDGATEAAQEASTIARDVRDQSAARAVLGAALFAGSLSQLREGRYHAAKLLADEAIALAESDASTDESERWQPLVSACIAASQAELVLGDLETAIRQAQRAIDLFDKYGDKREYHSGLTEALVSLAAAQFLISLAKPFNESGQIVPGVTVAGERILAGYREVGPTGTINDVVTARGILMLARSHVVDKSRGLDVADYDRVPAMLDDVIALVRPLAEQMPDAAIILANGLLTRAAFRERVEEADEDRAQAERCLRTFAARSTLVAIELGVLLDALGDIHLPGVLAGPLEGMQALLKSQQEAVELLRKSASWVHRSSLARSLGRVAVLSLQTNNRPLELTARSEAIAVWRELVSVFPEGPYQLLINLLDQSGRVVDGRPQEALDLATEARTLAGTLPPELHGLKAIAELNMAVSLFRLGMPADSRELLNQGIAGIMPFVQNPTMAGIAATAYTNLAQFELISQHFPEALAAAEQSVALYQTPGLTAVATLNEPLARLALSQAQRCAGQTDAAAVTLELVIGELRVAVLDEKLRPDVLAGALNATVGDLFDDVVEAFSDHPDLVRVFNILRRRTPQQAHLAVEALAEAFNSTEPTEHRYLRGIAREHHRQAPAEFEAAWRDAVGETPDWLQLEPRRESLVIAWWNTPSWRLSRDYLQSHPALFEPGTEILIEEFRLDGDDDGLVDRHLNLLSESRRIGAEAAYAPLLRTIEIGDWKRSEDREEHLTKHEELLRPEIAETLREHAAEGDTDAATLAAIVELAQRGERALAFEAARKPASMVDHLESAVRSTDVTRLAALATIVVNSSDDARTTQRAAVALAIARAIQKEPQQVEEIIRTTFEENRADERQTLTTLVADAIAHHPESAVELASIIRLVGDSATSAGASGSSS